MGKACVYLLHWKYAAGVYVGATTSLKRRRSWHRRHCRRGGWPNPRVEAVVMVHGVPRCTVLEQVAPGPGLRERLADRERHWIRVKRLEGLDVLNVAEPAASDFASDERRENGRERARAGLPSACSPQAKSHPQPLEQGGGVGSRAPAVFPERPALRVR